MSASKVYFTDMRCPVGTGLLDKLKKLIEKAGIDSIDMDSKFVAIKIHFGEPGNLSFLRPNFAKVVADKVTSLGGRPFLTDATPCMWAAASTPWNTWPPRRKTAFRP